VKECDPGTLMKLAVLVILASFVYFFCVTFIPIPDTGEDNAKYIVGFLVGTGVGSIITHYFRRDPQKTEEPKE
jgi:positive regulator of sigma E activity